MSRKTFYTLSRRDTAQIRSSAEVDFETPKIVSILSTNDGHQLGLYDRMLYFRIPRESLFPLDLNAGADSYVHRDNDRFFNKSINKIAYYLMHCREKSDDIVDELHQLDIITSRRALIDLMMTPYFPMMEWKPLTVTRFNNKLFIKRDTTTARDIQSRQVNPSWKYHFKLLQHCLSEDPKQEPNTDEPVDENKQLYCIYQSKMGNFRLLYSGEMNGIISDEKLTDLHDWNVINQQRFVFTNRSQLTSAFRSLQFWCKAYLSAVHDLYTGQQVSSGFIYSLEHKIVSDLPKKTYWKPKVCRGFLYDFLAMIIEEMKHVNCPYTTYVFAKDRQSKTITLDIHKGKTEHSFLTEDFIEFLQQK